MTDIQLTRMVYLDEARVKQGRLKILCCEFLHQAAHVGTFVSNYYLHHKRSACLRTH